MKVIFSTYLPVSLISGGPRVQLFQTAAELRKQNVSVSFFNQWNLKNFLKADLVHLFAANIGTYHLARILHQQNIPFVVSPIIFSQRSNNFIKLATKSTNFIKKIKPGFFSDFQITEDICNWALHSLPNTTDEYKLLNNGLNISKNKLTVIPNGVEKKFLTGSKTLFKNKYKVDNFILNVGHIGPERKNVLRLINAIKGTKYKLVVIGKISKDSSGGKCVVEANKNKNIILLDGIEHDSPLLRSAYASCKVFALPSLFETPGIAALEAALAGANIVITDKGGTKDYFNNFAEFVNPHSETSILSGIEKSFSKPKTTELQKHIQNNFLWSVVAKKTLAVYKKVLS